MSRPRHAAVRRRLLAGLTAALLLLGGCATAPTEYREPAPLTAASRAERNARVFDRAAALIARRYFDAAFRGVDWPAACARHRPAALAAPDDDTLYRVLNELGRELKESHLVAFSPRRTHELRTSHRAAIGVRILLAEGRRVVTDLVPGGPAARAGVQPGWLMVSRDSQPLPEPDTFRPRLGQPVTYGFLDAADQARELTFNPELIDFTRREARDLPGGIRYLRFDSFDLASIRWLSAELKQHRTAPAAILDLRQNPGGATIALALAAEELFPASVSVGTHVTRGGRSRERDGLALFPARYPGRLAVLTSGATGSAAEILAHVLQYHRRAVIVGQRTAGAVIVSRYHALPDGGLLQIPEEDYLGLDGQRLEGRGVTPDVPVTLGLADLRAGRDPALEAARLRLSQP